MDLEAQGITLKAVLVKAQTTVDGGWRLSFDVGQDEAASVLSLTALRDNLLQLAVLPLEGLFDG
jgi:hypothetical protein